MYFFDRISHFGENYTNLRLKKENKIIKSILIITLSF